MVEVVSERFSCELNGVCYPEFSNKEKLLKLNYILAMLPYIKLLSKNYKKSKMETILELIQLETQSIVDDEGHRIETIDNIIFTNELNLYK